MRSIVAKPRGVGDRRAMRSIVAKPRDVPINERRASVVSSDPSAMRSIVAQSTTQASAA